MKNKKCNVIRRVWQAICIRINKRELIKKIIKIEITMKQIKLIVVGLLMATTATFAQKGVEDGSTYGHGEDSVRCVDNLVQYGDAVKIKDYKSAYEPWLVVFNEAPKAKKTVLYSDGVKIVKSLLSKEKDPAKKAEYFELLKKIYDQRMKYYGNNKNYPTSYLQGMKALDMLNFKKGDMAVAKEALEYLTISLQGEPRTIQGAFVATYMKATVDLFKDMRIDAETVVNNYVTASNVLVEMQKIATDKNRETIADAKVQTEQVFAQSGAADCATIAKIFGPQLEANKANTDWLKRINRLLSNAECTEDELFFATSELLHQIEPTSSSARGLARMYVKQGDGDKAVEYYNQAINLEEDVEVKAKFYYELSAVNLSNNKYGAAKAAAYEAIALKANWGDPYLLLGKIYAAGGKTIGEKPYEKAACYWVAVDKFAKAKAVDSSEKIQSEATDLIRQYSQYFPSKEDLFMEGLRDGDAYTVGGFISERTTIRSKR